MHDDYISINRQAAIDAVHKNYDTILDFKSDGRTVANSFEDIINALPPAQPETWCDGCRWEYAFGYGECHRCKRHYDDMYEVKDEG